MSYRATASARKDGNQADIVEELRDIVSDLKAIADGKTPLQDRVNHELLKNVKFPYQERSSEE